MTLHVSPKGLHLVRHTAVADVWRSRCYGTTNVPLSAEGRRASRAMAVQLAATAPTVVYSSPLRRALHLAASIARHCNARLIVEPRLIERHFGLWEGRSWDEIYADSGDAMIGMLTEPATYRPGGGETTFELRDRVVDWCAELPSNGRIIAICHGGPIGALRGHVRGLAPKDWPQLVPPYGTAVELHA